MTSFQNARNPAQPSDNTLKQAILGLLIEHHPKLLSTQDIIWQIAVDPKDTREHTTVTELLDQLWRNQLIENIDRDFWFAKHNITQYDGELRI